MEYTVDTAIDFVLVNDRPRYFGFGELGSDHADCLGFVLRVLIRLGYDVSPLQFERRLTRTVDFVKHLQEIGSIEGEDPIVLWRNSVIGHIGIVNSHGVVFSFNQSGIIQTERFDGKIHRKYGIPKILKRVC